MELSSVECVIICRLFTKIQSGKSEPSEKKAVDASTIAIMNALMYIRTLSKNSASVGFSCLKIFVSTDEPY